MIRISNAMWTMVEMVGVIVEATKIETKCFTIGVAWAIAVSLNACICNYFESFFAMDCMNLLPQEIDYVL